MQKTSLCNGMLNDIVLQGFLMQHTNLFSTASRPHNSTHNLLPGTESAEEHGGTSDDSRKTSYRSGCLRQCLGDQKAGQLNKDHKLQAK